MHGSTGSFWGDLAAHFIAYALIGAVLTGIGILWKIFTGGGKK